MYHAHRALAALALTSLLFAGCAGPTAETQGGTPGAGSAATSPAVPPPPSNLTGGDFAWELLRTLRAEATDKNLFFSPASVTAALCLALEGASGTTHEAIADTLGLSDAAGQDCRLLVGALARTRNATGAEVDVANSVWIRETFAPSVNLTFLEALQTDFDAGAFVRPFDEETKDELNAWVSNATRGMIPTLLEELPDSLVMLLANAIYFDGRWAARFDANLTAPEDFRLPGGSTVQVPMMQNASAANVSLAYGDGFLAARLPYADGDHAMYILLPDENRTLEGVTANLTGEGWATLIAGMVPVPKVDLQLPKFSLDWGADLKPVLSNLGMEVAFDPRAADFTRIADVSPERLYIGFVTHKAKLEVDEEGTRAAAVTGVGIHLTSVQPPPPEFHVDRPFVLAIVDDKLGMPLFLGAVVNPLAG